LIDTDINWNELTEQEREKILQKILSTEEGLTAMAMSMAPSQKGYKEAQEIYIKKYGRIKKEILVPINDRFEILDL